MGNSDFPSFYLVDKRVKKLPFFLLNANFFRLSRGNWEEKWRAEFWNCRDKSQSEIIGSWERWPTTASGRENGRDHSNGGQENTTG